MGEIIFKDYTGLGVKWADIDWMITNRMYVAYKDIEGWLNINSWVTFSKISQPKITIDGEDYTIKTMYSDTLEDGLRALGITKTSDGSEYFIGSVQNVASSGLLPATDRHRGKIVLINNLDDTDGIQIKSIIVENPRIVSKSFVYNGKHVVKINDSNGNVLRLPKLLAAWNRQDVSSWSAVGHATFYPVSAGQHNHWPNRFDKDREVNGYTGYGFYNIGSSGDNWGVSDGNLTIFGDLSDNQNIFYRITFTEADDWIRNNYDNSMIESWDLHSEYSTNTTIDIRRTGNYSQWRHNERDAWHNIGDNNGVDIASSYNGITWRLYQPDPTRLRLIKNGGTDLGSLISPSKLEVFQTYDY